MTWHEWVGLPLVMFGASAVGLGIKWLGNTWFYIGWASFGLGMLICLAGGRFEKYMREWRKGRGGPGDYGDAHYTSGKSAGFSDSSDAADGDS